MVLFFLVKGKILLKHQTHTYKQTKAQLTPIKKTKKWPKNKEKTESQPKKQRNFRQASNHPFFVHRRSSPPQTPPMHCHKQEIVGNQEREANHLYEAQGNSRATLSEIADNKEIVVVLEAPELVKAPELYTRTQQKTWLKIEARKSREDVYSHG